MTIAQAQPYRAEVIKLLATEKLPVTDLPKTLKNFIVALHNSSVIGVAGVEVYGTYGLLRSLAVKVEQRGLGTAGKLLRCIESLSQLNQLSALYLLTETAPGYFERKGFERITRDEVPAEVLLSSEFSNVCPVSAIVMKKTLK